ncbi:MAG TPA: HNH endonuclease family protein, partial [Flavobacterium alvei]|nr:HNH endonuclease family protein [Flavobacterium alvei]
MEIIKSYFMLQLYLSSDNSDVINENIKYLENEFAKIYQRIVSVDEKEDDVLTYYWRAVSGKGYYSPELVEGVKNALTETQEKTEWIKNFVSGISGAFDTVLKVKQSDDSFISDLRYFNNMALAYPFFIKADSAQVSDKTFNRLARFLENIIFRSLLRGGRADIESRLHWFLVNGNTEESINSGIDEMLNKLKTDWWWGYWSDAEMIRVVDGGWFYGNRVDNYLLWKYELYLCNDNHPKPHKVTFNDLIRNESIEHIAPQTPTDGNPVANGYGMYDDKENPGNGIASGNWLNCVGNLMLISQSHNSSIGNKPFAQKLESYGKDNLLNQQREICDFV